MKLKNIGRVAAEKAVKYAALPAALFTLAGNTNWFGSNHLGYLPRLGTGLANTAEFTKDGLEAVVANSGVFPKIASGGLYVMNSLPQLTKGVVASLYAEPLTAVAATATAYLGLKGIAHVSHYIRDNEKYKEAWKNMTPKKMMGYVTSKAAGIGGLYATLASGAYLGMEMIPSLVAGATAFVGLKAVGWALRRNHEYKNVYRASAAP